MFDQEKYRIDVLDPARHNGGVPPEDLFRRYGLNPTGPPEDFRSHVDAVARYWPTLRRRMRYNKVLDALEADHQRLASTEQLTWQHFNQLHEELTAQLKERLREQVNGLSQVSPVVGADTVRHLVEQAGPGSESIVSALLGQAGIRVLLDPWPVPSAPPTAKARDVRENARASGNRISLGLLCDDGFRFRLRPRLTILDGGGRPVPFEASVAVTQAAKANSQRRQDSRKTATDNALTILADLAKQPDALVEQVLWELTEALRPHVEVRLPVRVVAAEAVVLGLDKGEAEELAYAMLQGGSVPAGPAARIEKHLRAAELRAAQRELNGLPTDDALVARIAEIAERVDRLVAEAGRERTAGQPERAAELLSAALREAVDDTDIAAALRSIPPPPVTDVRVGVEGQKPTVGWTPSVARTGAVTYRVIRTRGRAAGTPSDGVPVASTDANEVVDDEPVAGDDLFYTVFAGRHEAVHSVGMSAGPVAFIPGIANASVTSTDDEVAASWSVVADASEVEVVREPGAVRVPVQGRRRFADDTIEAGVPYQYRVRVGYARDAGQVMWSPVTVLTGGSTPVEPVFIAPVTQLTHRRAGDRVLVNWIWPEGVSLARVSWWHGTRGTDPFPPHDADVRLDECWRTTYLANGGYEIQAGNRSVVVCVRAVIGQATSDPVTVTVRGTGVRVDLRFRTVGLVKRRSEVVLRAAANCVLPDVVVVRRLGRVIPLSVADGEPVARIPAQELWPDREAAVPIHLPDTKGEYRLACFPDGSAASDVVLVISAQPGAKGSR